MARKRRRLITVEEIDDSAPAAAARTTSVAEGRLTDIQDPELLLQICRSLAPVDLARLACTSRMFGAKFRWSHGDTSPRSVADEAGERFGVLSRAGRGVCLHGFGSQATKSEQVGKWSAAASKNVMASGRHCAAFTVLSSYQQVSMLGLIRPWWDVENETDAQEAPGNLFFNTGSGSRYPGRLYWEGQRGIATGESVCLELDLDVGSLSVVADGECLGVLASGLSGPFCWAVSMADCGDSVRVDIPQLPVLPSALPAVVEVEFAAPGAIGLSLQACSAWPNARPKIAAIGPDSQAAAQPDLHVGMILRGVQGVEITGGRDKVMRAVATAERPLRLSFARSNRHRRVAKRRRGRSSPQLRWCF